MTDPRYADITMAIEMMRATVMRALAERETAVKVLVPDVGDRNCALITALTLALGILLATASDGSDTHFEKSIDMLTGLLRKNRRRFDKAAREAGR